MLPGTLMEFIPYLHTVFSYRICIFFAYGMNIQLYGCLILAAVICFMHESACCQKVIEVCNLNNQTKQFNFA